MRDRTIILLLLILVITFFAFYPALKNGFTNWDDNDYVTENPTIRSFSLHNFKNIFASFCLASYQPLTIVSYLIEYHFIKLDPFIYHLTNLIIHLLNCLLVFWLIYIISGNSYVPWLTAILFGIHPLQVESVAWISERKNVLYAFFFIGSLISYLHYIVGEKKLKYYFFCLGLFVLSLLSKTMAITLPLVMLLFDYVLRRKIDKAIFFEKIPFFVLSCIFGFIAIFPAYSWGVIRQENSYNLLSIIAIASRGIVFYLNKLFLPFKLSCFYPYDGIQNIAIYLYSIIVVVILFIVIIISGRFTKKIIFGTGLFLFAILPVLQFVPATRVIVADRYVYVSAIGIFYLLSEGIVWFYKRIHRYNHIGSIMIFIPVVCLIIFFSLLTFKRCMVWKDSITLWSDVLTNYPKAYLALTNRGFAYYNNGDTEQALSDYNAAIESEPRCYMAYRNRGSLYYFKKNNIDQAISDYSKAININPCYIDAYLDRGNIYAIKGNINQALSDYGKAIEINPNFASTYNNRAILYYENGQYDKAREDIDKAKILEYDIHPLLNVLINFK